MNARPWILATTLPLLTTACVIRGHHCCGDSHWDDTAHHRGGSYSEDHRDEYDDDEDRHEEQWEVEFHEEEAHDDVRAELAESLAFRVDVIRAARKAYREVRDERAIDALEHALVYGELALEDADADELERAAAQVPDLWTLAELLERSSHLYAEWDDDERAFLTGSLADHYRERAEAEGERRPDAHGGHDDHLPVEALADRAARVEVLRWARDAHVEAGWETAADELNRFVHIGELQLEGADGEALAEYSRGLSMEQLTEHVARAARFYAEWGREGRAASCAALADFYVDRDAARESAAAGTPDAYGAWGTDAGGHAADGHSDATIERLNERVEALQRQLEEMERLLERRGGGR